MAVTLRIFISYAMIYFAVPLKSYTNRTAQEKIINFWTVKMTEINRKSEDVGHGMDRGVISGGNGWSFTETQRQMTSRSILSLVVALVGVMFMASWL
jgi:hypothetical protein